MAPVFVWDDILALTIILAGTLMYLNGTICNKDSPGFGLLFVSPQVQDGIVPRNREKDGISKTRNIVLKLAQLRKDVVVFWGSQSGRSERLAKSLARECQSHHGIQAMAADLDDFDHEMLESLPQTKYVVFVVSTFGEGDPPDNAARFHQYLLKLNAAESTQRPLSSLKYFVFGLGNSTYQHFNQFVITVDETLCKAGGHRLGPLGLEDEIRRSDDDWDAWKEAVMSELVLRGLGNPNLITGTAQEPEVQVVPCAVTPDQLHLGERCTKDAQHPMLIAEAKTARLVSHRTGDGSPAREMLHIEFDIQSPATYTSGDHVAVWAMAPDEEISLFSQAFGWDENVRQLPIRVQSRGGNLGFDCPIPSPTTRDSILRYYIDICGPVNRDTVQALSHHAPTARSKEFLSLLLQNTTEMTDIIRRYITVAQLMHLADQNVNTIWPAALFEVLLHTLPIMQPRYFSIASSPKIDSQRIAITASVVAQERGMQDQPFYGLATNYLCSVSQKLLDTMTDGSSQERAPRPHYAVDGPRGILTGGKSYIQIRPSSFKLPQSNTSPLLLMAAGSGIAPFRAFIQERVLAAMNGESIGKILLFYGCRTHKEDIYGAEVDGMKEQLLKIGKEDRLTVERAFSQMNSKKMYVQDRMMEHRGEVLDLLLDNSAVCMVCGSVDLSVGIKNAVREILTEKLHWEDAQSERYLADMKASGRLREDVWA